MRNRTLTVSQLNEYVKGVFQDELILHNIYVEGEIFEFKQTSSATFITLRENDCLLHCVCFDNVARFEAGDKATLFGTVTYYERSGKISFVFKRIEKTGMGKFWADFATLKDKLQQEGVFDNKKTIRAPIRKIAVVTSETGAVIHDFITTVHRKRKFTDVYLYPATVQGKSAASKITECLREADAENYDLIVIARGGGSSDDLNVFNDESLARAIAHCSKPVISAVGHETDFTICDFASSLRAGTPSMAGEYISRANEEFFDRLEVSIGLLKANIERLFARKSNALYKTAAALSYKSEIRLERAEMKISSLAAQTEKKLLNSVQEKYRTVQTIAKNISDATADKLAENSLRFEIGVAKLNANNPLRILSLGYSKLYKHDGQAVTFDNVAVGEEINAFINDGKLAAKITAKHKSGGHNGT